MLTLSVVVEITNISKSNILVYLIFCGSTMYKFYSLVPDSGILQFIQKTDFLFMARGKILTIKAL